MTRFKSSLKSTFFIALVGVILAASVAWQGALAQGTLGPAEQPPAQPAALATSLSYYFISGATFTLNGGGLPYSVQANDCVNQMPLATHMLAPVHLPQASVVVSMTLFTVDTIVTTTFSTAYFAYTDGQGGSSNLFSVDSDSGIATYQNRTNAPGSPITIDNQHYAYEVLWRKVAQETDADSPYLSLCGVRLAYYAPVAATFLPVTIR